MKEKRKVKVKERFKAGFLQAKGRREHLNYRGTGSGTCLETRLELERKLSRTFTQTCLDIAIGLVIEKDRSCSNPLFLAQDYRMASTHCVLEIAILILALTVCGTWAGSGGSSHNNHNGTADNTSAASTHSFHVVKLDFHRIETPFTIAIWVLIASLGKLGKN